MSLHICNPLLLTHPYRFTIMLNIFIYQSYMYGLIYINYIISLFIRICLKDTFSSSKKIILYMFLVQVNIFKNIIFILISCLLKMYHHKLKMYTGYVFVIYYIIMYMNLCFGFIFIIDYIVYLSLDLYNLKFLKYKFIFVNKPMEYKQENITIYFAQILQFFFFTIYYLIKIYKFISKLCQNMNYIHTQYC